MQTQEATKQQASLRDHLQARVQSLTRERDDLQTKFSDLQSQNSALSTSTAKSDALQLTLDSQTQKIATLESQLSQQTSRLAELESDARHRSGSLNDKNMEITKMAATEKSLREQQETLFKANAEIQQKLTQAEGENSRLVHSSEMLTSQISRLTQDLENMQLEKRNMSDLKSQHQNDQITSLSANV